MNVRTKTLAFGAAFCLALAGMAPRVEAQAPAAAVPNEAPLTAADREHWAFRPLESPAVPPAGDSAWPIDAIDRFVLEELHKAGLEPQPAADAATLLRRLTFDLTGLPPTPDEVRAFLADRSPDAYERVVDRLLASPASGERMAQHWLDLARFAETDGFEFDHVRPDAWKYRDWVIRALNEDLPYDRFVQRQLAGDLSAPSDEQAAVATGFLLCGPDMPDLNSQEERRHNVLNEMTASVGAVFLGIQIGCAQCHDHKYDPISQGDFYRLRACFESAEFFDRQPAGRVMRELPEAAPSRVMLAGDFRRPGPTIEPGFPRICDLASGGEPGSAALPSGVARRVALARWMTRPDRPLALRVIVNRLWQWHFGRGLSHSPSDFGNMGQPPTHPKLLDWLAGELPRQGWSLKSMHRRIVLSATYRQASRPLEHNAESRGRWNAAQAKDPNNGLLWHAPRRRLEGESIRDAMLAAAGRLNLERGGPGVMAPLPPELEATLLKGQWTTDPDAASHRRRSVYLFVRRNLQFPLFESFDRPDALQSCPERATSTTSTQALTLWNSDFSLEQARALAGRVANSPTPAAAVESAYLLAYGRTPTSGETDRATQFLGEQAARLQGEGGAAAGLALPVDFPPAGDPFAGAALVDFCLALFNGNEFVYVD